MSDDIPLELQAEIIKRLPVKSLLQLRSVSKTWKCLIASSDFIKHYSGQQQHLLVSYYDYEQKYVSFVDDDTFPQHKVSHYVPRLVKMLNNNIVVGSSHGLVCLHDVSYCDGRRSDVATIWNISIRKAVSVVVPNIGQGIYLTVFGFGVCRATTDAKIVKVTFHATSDMNIVSCIPHQVEVFTLSTGTWRSPYGNFPRKSICFFLFDGVFTGGVFYWFATDRSAIHGGFQPYILIISFDMTSEEFREVTLPHSLVHRSIWDLSMFKLKESLVVLECVAKYQVFSVWMMEEDGVSKSFTKVFTFDVNKPVASVQWFRKSGEPILQIIEDDSKQLFVYEPYSKRIDNLGIDGMTFGNFVCPYMESLLMLDQPNFTV